MLASVLSHLMDLLPFVPLLGLMNWRNPGMEYLSGTNIYDFGLNNETGLSPYSTWTPANLANLESVNWQRPDTSQQTNPGNVTTFLNNEATMREVFGLTPGQGGGGVGPVPGGSSGPSAPANSTLTPNTVSTMNVPSQLSTTPLTPLSTGASAAPTITGAAGAGAGAAGAGGAAAGSTSSAAAAPWWKTVLGNKALMSGAITAVGSIYGQYDQKKQAKDAYKYQQGELAAQRAYAEEQLARRQNSPVARMTPALMQMAVQIFGQRLRNRGYGNLLDIMMGQIPSGGA